MDDTGETMFIEMKLFGVTIDTLTQKPVVLLKSRGDDATIPMWISSADAISIAVELIGRTLVSRGGWTDLLSALLKETEMAIARIVIDGFNDGAFNASIHFTGPGGDVAVKVRASEAIIASLKYRLPVLVAEDILAQASTDALHGEEMAKENDARRFVDFLESLKPEDFGKFPM